MSSMGEPQTKGISISGSREWVDGRLGSGWFMRTARQHEPSWPEQLASNGWYAVRVELWTLHRAHEALEWPGSVEDMIARIAADSARKDLRGILRAFLWVVSPKMFLASAPKIWATYADFTKIELVRNDPGFFVAGQQGEQALREAGQVPLPDRRLIAIGIPTLPIDRTEHRRRVIRLHERTRPVIDRFTRECHVIRIHNTVYKANTQPVYN